MAATPKPLRKVAKTIKKGMKETRQKAGKVTTYGKEYGKSEIKAEKKKPLSSLKDAAQFRITNKIK